MVDEGGFVRVWDIVAGRFRVEMVGLIDWKLQRRHKWGHE